MASGVETGNHTSGVVKGDSGRFWALVGRALRRGVGGRRQAGRCSLCLRYTVLSVGAVAWCGVGGRDRAKKRACSCEGDCSPLPTRRVQMT